NNTIYAITAVYPRNNQYPGDVTRFLESFHFIEKTTKDWKVFSTLQGALQTEMPGIPKEKITPPAPGTKSIGPIHQFLSTDNKTGVVYYLQYYMLGKDFSFRTTALHSRNRLNYTAEMPRWSGIKPVLLPARVCLP
ncbi:MAG TPA: hypothetical protein VNZ86_07045, partial [Bacteroidia bacterium]|nr:hypothetical protein [Bacteroidia bacterium]